VPEDVPDAESESRAIEIGKSQKETKISFAFSAMHDVSCRAHDQALQSSRLQA
jgi:hypothetical protein